MEKIKTSLRRFIYFLKHDFFNFENVVFSVAIILCLVWTYGAIESMSRNWVLSETLRKKKNELTMLELEVENLELENVYYSSEEYQELSARVKLNKKLPGETLVYLPKNSDYAKEKHKTKEEKERKEKTVLAQWLSLLLGI